MKNKKYVFVTGVPGSRWGKVEQAIRRVTNVVDQSSWLPYLQDDPQNLTEHVHKFYGPFMQHGDRFDNLHIMGPDAVIEEIDRAYDNSDPRPIRFVRCHWFAYQLDWIAENLPEVDIMMMFREGTISLKWWLESGGWNIQYPCYKWYGDTEKLRRQIHIENECMLKFMREQKLNQSYDVTTDGLKKFIHEYWPDIEEHIVNDEWPEFNIQDKTVWPVLYKGTASKPVNKYLLNQN